MVVGGGASQVVNISLSLFLWLTGWVGLGWVGEGEGGSSLLKGLGLGDGLIFGFG